MKLYCSVTVLNRLLPSLSLKPAKRCRNATLAIMKPPKDNAVYLVLITPDNKSGYRYKIQGNIEKTFGQFSKEGKATIRFKEPPHDLAIVAEQIPLKNFMLAVKKVWSGDEQNIAEVLSEKCVQLKSVVTKLDIVRKSDYPVLKGFPSTLQTLNISDCQLKKFDIRISRLKNLSNLCLSKNNLTEIPIELGELPLKKLSLSENKLVNIRKNWLFLSGRISKSLEYLDLSGNQMGSVPTGLSRLFSLKTINLKNNCLSELPFRICLLPRLQLLNISHNQFQALPGSIRRPRLRKLDTLDVSNNFDIHEHHVVYRIPKNRSMHSLLELSARVAVDQRLQYNEESLPRDLVASLDQAKACICGTTCIRSYGKTESAIEVAMLANTFISTERILVAALYFHACSPQHVFPDI